MQQNSMQLDGKVTCLLVQTINGQQQLRLVAIQQDVFEQYKQPLIQQSEVEAVPLLQNDQQQQQQFALQQQQQQLYQQQLAQQQLNQQQQQYLLQQQQLQQEQLKQQQFAQQQQQQTQDQQQQIYYQQQQQYQQQFQQKIAQVQQPEQPIQINEAQQELAEIAKDIDPNFNETEYHSRLVSIYNKLFCFVTFYVLVNVACFVIQYTLHGSISAASFWIASGSILIFSMGCSCCGVRYSLCWLLTIHLLFLTAFFALEIIAFIKAIQHPILDEYVDKGDFAYNARLLPTSYNFNNDDCLTLKSSYPKYYEDVRSECEFQEKMAHEIPYGAPIGKSRKHYQNFVTVTEYTTVLQKAITAVYSFGLLLSIIIYFYFIKEFFNFYRYNKQINLHKRKQELQKMGN